VSPGDPAAEPAVGPSGAVAAGGRVRPELEPESSGRLGYVVPKAKLPDADDLLAVTLRKMRLQLKLAEAFPPEVEADAAAGVAGQRLPERDLTRVPFVTIDPEGATDLDQALHLERSDSDTATAYRVYYAIADVPSLVAPGGAVDAEARGRGQTMYAPDGRIPLHPTIISEGAGSLLPDQLRSAFVWEFELDATATVTSVHVERARVRSRRQCSYVEVQAELDGGTAPEWLRLLREVGLKRIELERERGGASLNRPDEEVNVVDGVYTLSRRQNLPVEDWNAQLSLMTGMAAARLMLDGKVGVLRTMPAPDEETLARFRRQANALGAPWDPDLQYGEYLRTLDPSKPQHLAIIHAAASLFRGAGYAAFDGDLPAHTMQAAVAAPYAHATAPLRRLVDRFVLVTCEALCLGRKVPPWVRDALPELPQLMASSDGRANQLEARSLNAIEAALLSSRIGEEFDAVVVQTKQGGGVIQLTDPVVTATMAGSAPPGQRVRAKLLTADIATGEVLFRRADG
jgi:exoribonuclease R